MQLPKWLDEYLEYVNDNMLLIMKAVLITLLIAAGPFIAVATRMNGGNYSTIIIVGVIFEVIGIILTIFLMRKEYIRKENREDSPSPKKKK